MLVQLSFSNLCYQVNSILDNHTDSTRRCIGYVGASESTSLVLVSIFVPLGATNTCVRTLLDEVPKDI